MKKMIEPGLVVVVDERPMRTTRPRSAPKKFGIIFSTWAIPPPVEWAVFFEYRRRSGVLIRYFYGEFPSHSELGNVVHRLNHGEPKPNGGFFFNRDVRPNLLLAQKLN